MEQIKILGAGPSGLAAAINLAKAGYRVEVFERNKDVGVRFGGDLQGLENWSGKEDILEAFEKMNIRVNFDCDGFSNISVSNGIKTKDIDLKKTGFYLVKRGNFRGSFDYGLKEQAIEAGVTIHFGRTIDRDKADIVAVGPVLSEVPAIAKGIIFKTSAEDMAVGILDNKAAYKGYSYLLITKGYGCMCSVVFEKLERVNECYKKTAENFSKIREFDIQNPKEISGVISFSTKNIFREKNNLFIGEAAGLQDMLWGFGIRYAVTSGFWAARSIIEKYDYEKKAKSYFGDKLKAGLVNRFLWENVKLDGRFLSGNRNRDSKNIFWILYSFYNYNFLQKLVYPFALFFIRKKYSRLRI